MSQENISVIRRSIDAFNSGDVEEMIALADPELEWRPAYRGHDGFRGYWRGTQEIWDHFHFEPEQFLAEGDGAVVIGRGSGRAKGSGIEIDQQFAMFLRVRHAKLVFGQTFTDIGEARAAAERVTKERE